jgi:hypothetical protein
MRLLELTTKVDLVLDAGTTGDNLVDFIQDNDLEYHKVTVDEDDPDVLVFTKYADN